MAIHEHSNSVDLSSRFSGSASSALDQLCAAIAANNMASFTAVLDQVKDLDADNSRALRTCLQHDRFAMAKELFLRGVASTVLLKSYERERDRQRYYFDEAEDDDYYDSRGHRAYQEADRNYTKLNNWKTTFDKDIAPLKLYQKMLELEKQIAALREELHDARSPARSVIKKPSNG